MIFLVFTQQGLDQIKATACEQRAVIWHNPALLTDVQMQQFSDSGVSLFALSESIAVEDDKAVYRALQEVENHTDDDEIYIEMA